MFTKVFISLLLFVTDWGCRSFLVVPTRGATGDSTVIASWPQKIVLDGKLLSLPITIRLPPAATDKNGQKFLIFFYAPKTVRNPDGIYEIHLTASKKQAAQLSSYSPSFVNVLDMYAFSSSVTSTLLTLDITGSLNLIPRQRRKNQELYLTALFTGNKKPDGAESDDYGMLTFDSLQIVHFVP